MHFRIPFKAKYIKKNGNFKWKFILNTISSFYIKFPFKYNFGRITFTNNSITFEFTKPDKFQKEQNLQRNISRELEEEEEEEKMERKTQFICI